MIEYGYIDHKSTLKNINFAHIVDLKRHEYHRRLIVSCSYFSYAVLDSSLVYTPLARHRISLATLDYPRNIVRMAITSADAIDASEETVSIDSSVGAVAMQNITVTVG